MMKKIITVSIACVLMLCGAFTIAPSFTGKASATNLLNGDKAEIHVSGGNGVEPGSYVAYAAAISNKNYRLPASVEENDPRAFEYTIEKADAAVTFPDKALLTYGESLAAARFEGEKGDGTFAFEKPDVTPQVKDSGRKYKMVFTPDEPHHYNGAEAMIEVEVLPKEVSLTWHGTDTRYYDGKPSEVYAVAGGLIGKDKCDVEVKNGDAAEPGTHTAEATALSNENYSLPESRTAEYTILAVAGGTDGNTMTPDPAASGAATSDPADMLLLGSAAVLTAAAAACAAALTRRRKTSSK